MKQCQDLPGQVLFQYVVDGEPRPVTSTDVNTYLRDATGQPVTAKDFRTWMGTLMAASALASLPPPASETEGRRVLKGVVDVVSSHLRNTPAVCRGSYVHPVVIDAYLDGTLPDRWAEGPSRAGRRMIAEERKLLALLAPPRRSRPDHNRARTASRRDTSEAVTAGAHPCTHRPRGVVRRRGGYDWYEATAGGTVTERTRPDEETRQAERAEADTEAGADRMPTPDEERAADSLESDPEVAKHYEEMAERGANQKGEGRIP